MPSTKLYIFISHASANDVTVTRLHNELESAGIKTWVDHVDGLEPGDNWAREIQQAAHDCAAGLFILSPASAQSAYCEAEWNRVLALGKRLYIAMIEPVPLKDIPLRLGTIQYADLAKDWAGGFDALRKAIGNNTELNPDAPAVAQAAPISGSFPRWHLDLPLIGRDAELKTVQDALKSNQRIVAILGLGGVGKTRLAAEVAARADFPASVVWHKITLQSTVKDLTSLIRSHLNLISTTSDEVIWVEAGKRGLLLVLDNAEDCTQPAAYAEQLDKLDTSNGTRVLMTSRAVWRELKHVKTLDLRAPSLDAAVGILKAMVGLEPPSFPLGGKETELAQAARQHPRLIEYAVRWLDSYPADYVLTTLTTLGGADASEALDEMVRKTVEQVRVRPEGEAAIAALRRLAVTRGGFTFEAAKVIMPGGNNAGDVVDYPRCLALLKQWGLVQLERQRYTIDPLVIAAVGEDSRAHHSHYDYYSDLALDHYRKGDYLGLDPESANLEAAFEWALATGDGKDALRIAKRCAPFLANRGRFDLRLDWFERLKEKLAEHPDTEVRADSLNGLAVMYREHPFGNRQDNWQKALAYFDETLKYWTDENDQAGAQNNLGLTYVDLASNKDSEDSKEDRKENLQRGMKAYEEVLKIWTLEKDAEGYAMVQNNLGEAYAVLADLEEREVNVNKALACYQEALKVYNADSPEDYSMVQNNLGLAYVALGAFETTLTAYNEALKYRTPETAPLEYAKTQRNLGIAYQLKGDLDKAVASWSEAEKYYRQMKVEDEADLMLKWIANFKEGSKKDSK